ncbi:hypothetical protein BJ912DRAFT_436489 [Pholiota molesta]|nr:hypothetical protein BJ912DRAFT_436489 [Pholiota molesta]
MLNVACALFGGVVIRVCTLIVWRRRRPRGTLSEPVSFTTHSINLQSLLCFCPSSHHGIAIVPAGGSYYRVC